MKKITMITLAIAILFIASQALAIGSDTFNYNTAEGGDATAIGVGVGVGIADVDNTNVNLNAIKNTNVNRNTNLNLNTNKNTNVNVIDNKDYNFNSNHQCQGQNQGQVQNQGQNQGQGQSQAVDNSDTLTITIPDKYEYEGIRPFANPGEMDYPSMPGRVESKLEPHNFWATKDIITLGNQFRVGDIVAELSTKMDIDTSKVDPDAYMKVFVSVTETSGVKRIGFVRALAKKADVDSLIMLYICLYRAHVMGGDAVLVIGEGWKDETKASGWGIGFHHSQAFMSDNERGSGVATGGTGYSRGKASNATYPWVRAIVLTSK